MFDNLSKLLQGSGTLSDDDKAHMTKLANDLEGWVGAMKIAAGLLPEGELRQFETEMKMLEIGADHLNRPMALARLCYAMAVLSAFLEETALKASYPEGDDEQETEVQGKAPH